MIHNKYVTILQQYLPNYQKELYGRELVNKLSMSQKSIALALDDLEKEGILKSRKSGNIKYFSLNTKKPEIKDILLSAEIAKKINFLKKHKILTQIFSEDDCIVGIFGSYASGTEKTDSDLDLFIIGRKKDETYQKLGKKFDIDVSIVYFTNEEFAKLSKEKNNLVKEIIRNHILISNTEKFIDTTWRNFYGIN